MFDAKYRKIEKKNMILPSEILAFKLLRKANITKLNYESKVTLYDEAKRSLKKFKGDVCETNGNMSSNIKLEP